MTRTVTCQVSTVQRFRTAFTGKAGSGGMLEGAQFSLEHGSSDGAVVHVTGMDRQQCTKEQFDQQEAANETGIVRFKRYDGDGCPEDFDRAFAPSPQFM